MKKTIKTILLLFVLLIGLISLTGCNKEKKYK